MNPIDDEILEILSEENAGTRAHLADQLDRARNYVGDRLSVLVDYGLVEKPSHGFYVITDKGRDYLAGELDADELSK